MSEARKVLLVGSSFSAAPIFFALKKQGLHVSVCGKNESDPCHQYADASFYIDYSSANDLQEVIESENFDFLVPTCNDYAYMSCAAIADKQRFPGFDMLATASTLHTKNLFRTSVDDLGLPAPSYKLLKIGQSIDTANLRYPLLVKPIDSFSGRGMTKVMDYTHLTQAVVDAYGASRGGEWIVLEQFVEGNLHSHSAFIQDRQVTIDFFVDEFCTVYPYQVNCSNHPSALNENIRNDVRTAINKLVGALDLADGLLHTQFISDGREFWIIETMRRCPGDLYGSLVQMSTGIDYADLFIRPYLGQKLPVNPLANSPKFCGRHTISVAKQIINYSFSQKIPARNVDIVPLKISGEKLDAAPFDKLAILFAEYENAKQMKEISPRLAEYVHIREHERC